MKASDKICYRIPIKSEKDRQLYRKREERHIQGTPKIILGKAEPNLQEVWTDDLKNEQIIKLKQSNNSQKGLQYAKTIVNACCGLTAHFGHFIINQNMIFFNQQKEIFAWINPDICENHVKIYLPHTHQGELAMIRSIIAYLKLWFKCDYNLLTEVKHLNELAYKIDLMKFKPNQGFKAKSPERQFLANRRNSVNMDSGEMPQRYNEEGRTHPQHLLMENKSMKDMLGRSPGKQSDSGNFLTSSLSNKMTSPLKFAHSNDKEGIKNKTTLVSQKNGQESGNSQFQHRTFNNINSGVTTTPLNKSVGIKGENSYYPNKTTSNKNNKNHIVALINKHDNNPNQYGKNKLLLDDLKMQEMEKQKLKKGKEGLDGIGEELNDLFLSNIENQEENQDNLKQIEQEFSTLLE